ncbi:MAG: hypothetical protein ABMA02_19870 [Saprospiraceae bacterium]
MQIKIFNIPTPCGEVFNDELNAFLRSKKVVSVEDSLVQGSSGTYWVFKVQYLDDVAASDRDKTKVDV